MSSDWGHWCHMTPDVVFYRNDSSALAVSDSKMDQIAFLNADKHSQKKSEILKCWHQPIIIKLNNCG